MFVVRAKDWQPTQLRLSVQAEGGNRIYELTEASSAVMSLAQVNPIIFATELDHLWAMKRLLNQFSPEEVRILTPEARAK